MTKVTERRQVIELRKQGKSYSEIKKIIKVSKSSLSLWLRNVPLTDEQILGLKTKKDLAVERYRESMRVKRAKRNQKYYKEQKKKWLPFSKREEFVAGLFLYWGEGNKASRHIISINNTDPSVVKFSLYWFTKSLKIPKEKIRVIVHLYSDMDINKELNFWSKELKLDRSHFAKPYIKKTKKIDIDQRGFGHGTCAIYVSNTVIKEKILMAIKSIADNFGEKI